MVIHGRLDEEVDVSHGVGMHKAVPSQYQREPWWVPNRGHNDITEGPGMLTEYIRRIRNFLNSLDDDWRLQTTNEGQVVRNDVIILGI